VTLVETKGVIKVKEKSIIQVIRDKHHEFNEHIAELNGEHYVTIPNYYHNIETNEDYWAIVGALAFPANRTSGFAVIIAAIKNGTTDAPVFKVVAEIEESDVDTLLQTCEHRRYRYGYPHQLECFYGDLERFRSIVADFNQRQERGLYLVQPADFHSQNRSEIYLERIWSDLKPGSDGTKRILLGECDRLRAHLHNLPKEIQSIEDYPAVAALGYAVHSLELMKPWKKSRATGRYVDSDEGGWEYESWGDEDDDADDGNLYPTM
jgi:hypothetical protein